MNTIGEQLAFKALVTSNPQIDVRSNDARLFVETIAPLEEIIAENLVISDAQRARAERDQRQGNFPELFFSKTGAHPTHEQIQEHNDRVESEIDAQIFKHTELTWRAYGDTDKALAKLEADLQHLLSEPDAEQVVGRDRAPSRAGWAMEMTGARERLRGLDARRLVNVYREADDTRDRALVYLIEQVAVDQNWEQLALAGDVADGLGRLLPAITARKQARVPAWVRAARARQSALVSGGREALMRMIINGQKITRRNGAVRSLTV